MREREKPATTGGSGESGIILVNVLAVVALASAIVVTMLSVGESGIHRSQRFDEAAQALAYSMGAETSAMVVLRRDAEKSNDLDHLGEAWATLNEDGVPIQGGRFSLKIEDAQSRFNLNDLRSGGMVALAVLRAIVATLGLPADTADRINALIRVAGPLDDLRDLSRVALSDAQLSALSTMVTVLPGRTSVNANTAGEGLLGILMNNPVSAHFLVSRRDAAGFLTRDDLRNARIILPPGVELKSDYFRVMIDVTIGDTAQNLTSLLQRRHRNGQEEVVAISRKRGRAAPSPEPPA